MDTSHFKVVLAYLRTVDAVSRKRVLYHGTSPEVARRILSEGLVPDPKKRSWSDDPHSSFLEVSRKSFPGIYLTGNLLIALSSAQRVSGPQNPRAVVIVEVEEAGLVHDEDTIKHPLRQVLVDLAYERGVIYVERSALGLYQAMVSGKLDKDLKKKSLELLQSIDSRAKQGYGLERASMVEKALRSLLTRDTSVGLPNTVMFGKEYSFDEIKKILSQEGYDLKDLPSPDKAEEIFRSSLEEMSNKLRPMTATGMATDRFIDASRYRDRIGFSGANKIIAIVIVDSDYSIRFLYGSPSDPKLKGFFEYYGKSMTSKFDVIDTSGKKIRKNTKARGLSEVHNA